MNEQKKERKPTRLPALVIATALGLSTASYAENYDVTVANDDGTGSTDNTLSWAIRQTNLNPHADTITLKTDVTITGVMKTLIDGAPSGGDHDSGGGDLFMQSDDTRRTINGGGQFRPLFVKSGSMTIQNIDLKNGKAKGGDSAWGGGGAGLGGALFVYSGNVTVRNVTCYNNNAEGGNDTGDESGGGGMFGNSKLSGGGLFGDGISGLDGGIGGYGGSGNYGGFGGAFGGTFGGDGGFGGGGGVGIYGGDGGFGGGGSAGNGWGTLGGNGGFGGGGGFGMNNSGNGGFGGGGAGSFAGGGNGGYGGGDNYGGGAGFGGAIFAMNGTITLLDVSFSGNTVTAGTGGYENGTAKAKDVFICTSDLHSSASLCGAVVNACGTTSTSEIVGTFGSDCPATTAPEMDITGNGISIADGDTTPDSADHTHFGSTSAGSSVTRTYTIANSGDADLNLTGSGDLVLLDGANCTEFTVTAQPTSPVSSGGTTTFTVQYSPTDVGEDTCTVIIDNNDSDENPYDFSIKGTGQNIGWLPAIYMLLL